MIRKPHGKIRSPHKATRARRRLRIRKKVAGTPERPRICPTKSNKNLSVQVIDDQVSRTLVCSQTFGKQGVAAGPTKEGAVKVGVDLAQKMKEAGLQRAVLDRAGYPYHGVIQALTETLRENGIAI